MTQDLALWQARFRDHLQLRGYALRTCQEYAEELRPLFAFLASQGVGGLGAVHRTVLEGYRSHLCFAARGPHGQALTLSTQARRLAAVKAFFGFLARANYLVANPAAGLELPRAPRGLPRTLLSEDETRQLLEAADGSTVVSLRDRAVVELLYGTGLRNSELGQLTLDQVDLARAEIRLRRGKGGKSRVVPLGSHAVMWLGGYLTQARPLLVRDPRERLFFLSTRGLPLGRRGLSVLVRTLARRAGLAKPVTPHILRHACATHMLGRGAGLRHLQGLLGHDCLASTQRYTHLDVSDLRATLKRCHPRERA